MLKVLAIIPARSGSKSIPHKNIMSILGKPLIAYSIEHGLQSKLINRVIVSTDDDYYAEIAKKHGAEVPFIRPKEISDDHSLDIEFIKHALDWLKANENYVPDIGVQLRPTHPIRSISDLDSMIQILIDDDSCDSVRSVIENKSVTPFKMWKMEGNKLVPLMQLENIKEPYNSPRQILPKTYFQNASVDVIRTKTILEKNSLSGDSIRGYVMSDDYDIDYIEDFEKAAVRIANDKISEPTIKNKKICFDIDGVLATLTPGNDYSVAMPIKENISILNKLYDNDNTIVLFTARGSETGIDWKKITENQMKDWGVKYHELRFGKPGAEMFVDDRAVNINDIIK